MTKSPPPEQIDRERQVLNLRRAGVTFDVIAQQLGYADGSGAHKAYRRAMRRTLQQPADEIREIEVDRLDRLMRPAWEAALTGDMKASAQVLKIQERRARLLGLDHADGLAERQVRVEEQQGQQLAEAMTQILDSLGLSDDQRAKSREVIPQVLRDLMGTDD